MRLIAAIGLAAASMMGAMGAEAAAFKFDFGAGVAHPGWTRVWVSNQYSAEVGYGFEDCVSLRTGTRSVFGDQPFLFSVKVPEGNYAVTVTFGDDAGASDTTIKAELRRLMLEKITTKQGETTQRTFIVNVRTPRIAEDRVVRLKAREMESEMVNWDERLTLEFNGSRPCLRTLEIESVRVPTVFLIGDSTVCDQPREPWNSWGQMLPRFFRPEVAVANHAQSGESIKSSLSARRFEKIFSQMKSNDWLFVQFGHNDMKDRATNALVIYKENLKMIVQQTRERGATPVLVTSMERKGGIERDTLEGYPQMVREVAREESVALIDLHAMSKVFYRALGGSLDQAFQDGTHHNNYGSYGLARCVVTGIKQNNLGLAKFLARDVADFNPACPDAPGQFQMAVSPARSSLKPDGN